jgi:hypothetical protein
VSRLPLLLLCLILFVWQPLTVSGEIAATLPSLGMRGAPAIVELLVHGLLAALSVAAGWALWNANPAGPVLARSTMIGAAAIGVQALYWSVLPRSTFPSDRLPIAIATLVHSAVWLVYLRRSRRIRAIADGRVTSW